MVNYSLLIIGSLFCVMILVELIFNFTGLLKENYKQYQKNNKEYFTGEETTTTAEPTISYTLTRKASPDVYNNDDEGDDYYNKSIKQVTLNNQPLDVIDIGSLPTSLILLKTSDNKVYSYAASDSGEGLSQVAEDRFDEKQHFNIFRINDFLSFNRHIPKQVVDSTTLSFPFFVIKPVSDPDKYIGYDSTLGSLGSLGSFNHNVNMIKSVNYTDTNISSTSEQVSISLNFGEGSKEKLFDKIEALDFSSFTPSGRIPEYTEKDCNTENLIPKRAVESLCLSCNPDLIQ